MIRRPTLRTIQPYYLQPYNHTTRVRVRVRVRVNEQQGSSRNIIYLSMYCCTTYIQQYCWICIASRRKAVVLGCFCRAMTETNGPSSLLVIGENTNGSAAEYHSSSSSREHRRQGILVCLSQGPLLLVSAQQPIRHVCHGAIHPGGHVERGVPPKPSGTSLGTRDQSANIMSKYKLSKSNNSGFHSALSLFGAIHSSLKFRKCPKWTLVWTTAVVLGLLVHGERPVPFFYSFFPLLGDTRNLQSLLLRLFFAHQS